MLDLITEILGLLAMAALLGLAIGYLIWGWGRRSAVSAARAEGAASARTSVDGSVPMREQLDQVLSERDRLRVELTRLQARHDRAIPAGAAADLSEASDPPDPGRDVALAPGGWVGEPRAGPDDGDAEVAEEFATDAPSASPDPIRATTEVMASSAVHFEPVDRTSPVPADPPASLLDDPPADTDDLKRIKGVGPKMERVLNDNGIYLFRQIANFSSQDVAWVNKAIAAFPGRIERDNWVGQAQELYREKYGSAHDA